MGRLLSILLLLSATAVQAETVYAQRTIRVGDILAPNDVSMRLPNRPGAHQDLQEVVGKEARVTLYAGHPVRIGDVGPPALVMRNSLVLIVFEQNGLRITSEGRSLSRGAAGDRVRVMNLASRASLFGVVQSDGTVQVAR